MKWVLGVAAICMGLALSPMAAVGQEGITLNSHQKDLINKVSSYFGGINTLQGSFVQTDSDDRRMKGKFYLSRPGRFRFDYARPSRQIVETRVEVSDLAKGVQLDAEMFKITAMGWKE